MPNSDAQLLALGVQLDVIAHEWLDQLEYERTTLATGNDPNPDATWATTDNLNTRMFELCEDILAQRAHTRAGLTVQAKAVSLVAAELWDNPAEHNPHERMFIEAVHAFLGITPIPQQLAA
jgi:hypothetical protein